MYTRLLLWSSKTMFLFGSTKSRCWVNSLRTKEPPSESKLSLSTSVSTSIFSRGAAEAAGAEVGTWPGVAVTAAEAAGTALALALAAAAGAGAVAATSGLGKNVALLPLYSCHWSHNKTREKPKITQRMVRRISVMGSSLRK